MGSYSGSKTDWNYIRGGVPKGLSLDHSCSYYIYWKEKETQGRVFSFLF